MFFHKQCVFRSEIDKKHGHGYHGNQPKSMKIAGHFLKFQMDRSPSSDGVRIFPDQGWKGKNFLFRLVLFLERFRRNPRPR